MTVDDIFDALYLQAKDQIGLTKLRDIVLTDESINRLQFNREGQEPVEFIKEKHGRWIDCGTAIEGDTEVKCSECGEVLYWLANYCPNCGAKMDESEAEE